MRRNLSALFRKEFKHWLKQQNYLSSVDFPYYDTDDFQDVIFYALSHFFNSENIFFTKFFPDANIDIIPLSQVKKVDFKDLSNE